MVPAMSKNVDLTDLGRHVQFNVLGTMTVVDGTEQLNIGGVKQRTVLAMLVAGGGRAVSNDVIAEAVYADEAPGKARRRIQTYVSNLRAVVGDVIAREGGGWALRVDRQQIDALVLIGTDDIAIEIRDRRSLSRDAFEFARTFNEFPVAGKVLPVIDSEVQATGFECNCLAVIQSHDVDGSPVRGIARNSLVPAINFFQG